MSYNSTGLDSFKVKWINDLMKTFKVDYFQLQEHFKATKTIDNFFKKAFPDYDCYSIPGHRTAGQESGRAKGGLSQISCKKLDIRKERVFSKHWRNQAQILHMKGYKLLWINCYCPTDPQTLKFDDEELSAVLNDLENILENNIYDDCLLGGDFNFDNRRATGFTSLINEFLEKVGLRSVWDKFTVDFTHIHTDLKSTSTLDHFFGNSDLIDRIEDAGAVHLGDNLSRHSPIMLKLQIPDKPIKEKLLDNRIKKTPAWYKSSLEDKLYYSNILKDRLCSMNLPQALQCSDVTCKDPVHSMLRDNFVRDILNQMIEASHLSIPISSRKSSDSTHQLIPDWNLTIKPLKADSLFWHAVWISAGRPSTGGLYQVMCHVRSKYHRAIRIAKREEIRRKNMDLCAAVELGNVAMIREMQNSLGKKKTTQQIPDCLEGKVDHSGILNHFRKCYKELYNSSCTKEAVDLIKVKLQNIISSKSTKEVDKITPYVIKIACNRMKSGKNDVSGSYSSDAFLNGPDILFEYLSWIFKSYLVHGTLTDEILNCAFMPLYKGGFKNPESFDSYRAIVGASQLLKLFEYVILIIWGDVLSTDSMQFGFKSGLSTTQCTWLVNEVATYFMRRGTAISACLLDCSKAFDKCRYDKLFTKLIEKGLPSIVVRVLIFMYQEQKGWVKLGSMISEPFSIGNGTRQGSVLSPLLFSVYLDGLLKKLRDLNLGCHIKGYWLGACGYADDLILLATSRDSLQRMLNICEKYSSEHNLEFSTNPVPSKSKTKCIYFCGRLNGVKYPDQLVLNGKKLPWVTTADHLGHCLSQMTNMEKDCERARAKFISKSTETRDQLRFAKPCHILKAYEVMCMDAYGSMLWDLQSSKAEQFFKSWNTAVKHAYNVPLNTFTYLVEGYLAENMVTLRNRVLSQYAGFFRKLLESPSREVRGIAKIVHSDPRSTTCKNLRLLSSKTGLRKPFEFSPLRIKSNLTSQVVPQKETWRIGLLNELFKLRSEKFYKSEEFQSITAMINSLCST